MKGTIIYYSQTDHTKNMAELIKLGMEEENVEAKCFSIDEVDQQWVMESGCVIIGTPTYYADVAAKIKVFMEEMGKYQLAGKLGGAFSTAAYVYGGGELAIQSILTHMLFHGMMVYSSGCSENPPIHLGPIEINGMEATTEVFREYGRRMAKQLKRVSCSK